MVRTNRSYVLRRYLNARKQVLVIDDFRQNHVRNSPPHPTAGTHFEFDIGTFEITDVKYEGNGNYVIKTICQTWQNVIIVALIEGYISSFVSTA